MSCEYYEYSEDHFGCTLCYGDYASHRDMLFFRKCNKDDHYTYNCSGYSWDKDDKGHWHCPIRNFALSINYDPDKICGVLKLEYNGYSRIIAKCSMNDREMSPSAIKSICMCSGDCADYSHKEPEKDPGGCYISTACVVAKGLPDDCDELQTLRVYRDKMVQENAAIAELVKEYYKNAPVIVEKINQEENSEEIYNFLYNNLVVACVTKLKENKNQEAVDIYTSVYQELKKKYIL